MRSEFMRGKEGNLVTVNGLVNPTLSFAPGQVQRWQVLNASNARFYWLGVQGFSLYVVGTDGGLLKNPYPVSRVLLSPGERVDLLVKAGAKGTYKLLSYPHDRGMSALQQVTLMTLPCGGKSRNDPLPVEVDPTAARVMMDTSMLPRKRIELSMMMGQGFINGISFTGMDHTAEFHSMLGDYEVWEVVNQSGMEHPFHQHVNACQVLSISGGDSEYAQLYTTAPAWKDTVIIPKWGSVTMLVPVMDFTGMAMFHCHILEHEDIGMMAAWMIMDPMEPPMPGM
jgi:FtsP/CotA-like multicopper oxidase with cupredoxin domain